MSLTSLREAVLEIAGEMEEEAKTHPLGEAYLIKSYAKQLRLVCKAAGEDVPQQVGNPLAGFIMNPEAQHSREIDKYRSEFRKNKEVVNSGFSSVEESFGGESVVVDGGPACDEGSLHIAID